MSARTDRTRATERACHKRLADQRREMGLCACGRDRAPNKKQCQKCIDVNAQQQQKREARAAAMRADMVRLYGDPTKLGGAAC